MRREDLHDTSSNVGVPNITPRPVAPQLFVDVYDRAPCNIPVTSSAMDC